MQFQSSATAPNHDTQMRHALLRVVNIKWPSEKEFASAVRRPFFGGSGVL
jgi:hypothetical protein